MPSSTPPQPQLKRRASLRDRLRGTWQRPPQPLAKLAEEDDAAPRVVYKPKHAAADFSRLPVSPLSPPSRYQQRHPHALHSLDEQGDGRDASAPRTSHAWSRHGDDEARAASPRDRESTRRSSRVSNDNYTLVPDAPSQVPVVKQPPVPFPSPEILAETVREKREDDVDDDHQKDEDDEEDDADPAPLPPPEPPSDYELFLAHAEAQDRRWREQLLPSPAQLVHPTGRVRPDPHRQFATAGTTATPAAPTSTSAARSDRQSHSSARSPTDTRDPQRRRGTDPSRPARRESRRGSGSGSRTQTGWTPRATTAPITPSPNPPSNSKPEKEKEKKHPPVSLTRPPRATTAPAQTPTPSAPSKSSKPSKSQPPPPSAAATAAPQLVVSNNNKTARDDEDDDDMAPGAEHQSHVGVGAVGAAGAAGPHRQASLRQRFVEYIRPSRGQRA